MGEQHVYHDVPLASIVNDYRVCRIFCMRVIMACVAWLAVNPKHNLTADYEKAVYVIQQMVDEISACIPFHMVSFPSRYIHPYFVPGGNNRLTHSHAELRPPAHRQTTRAGTQRRGSLRRVLPRVAALRRRQRRNRAAGPARLAERQTDDDRDAVWVDECAGACARKETRAYVRADVSLMKACSKPRECWFSFGFDERGVWVESAGCYVITDVMGG